MFINTITQAYPLTAAQIIAEHPRISFTLPFSLPEGYAQVAEIAEPAHNPATHAVRERAPVRRASGVWEQRWLVEPLGAEVIAERQAQAAVQLQAEVVRATQQRLDDFARTRNYDGILSVCTYATSSVPRFAAEGQRAVALRDATWSALYSILEAVHTGTRSMPASAEQVLSELPALAWAP